MLLRQLHLSNVTLLCIPFILTICVFFAYFHDGLYHVPPSPSPHALSSTAITQTTSTPALGSASIQGEIEEARLKASNPQPLSQNVFPGTDFLPSRPIDPLCENGPDVSRILLIIKTGASETYDRLPTQFMSMTRCLSDFLVFSDMEETVMGYRVQDILGETIDEVRMENGDFDLWRRQRSCLVDQKNCQQWSSTGAEAWNLDKYKNVRQSHLSYKLRPDYDWYLHIDADTYVHWPNMVQMLKPFSPRKDYFFGSFEPSQYGDFNHGGSGYILSQSAMKKFHEKADLEHYDRQAREICCGDMLMTVAVKETIDLANTNMFPTMNGRKPFTLPFGPRQWCQPIATLHKLNSEEVANIWEFEQSRIANHSGPASTVPPLLIKDLYYEYFKPRLVPKLEDWDNMNDDYLDNVWYYFNRKRKSRTWKEENGQYMDHLRKGDLSPEERRAHRSFEDCRIACEAVDECLQFRWQDDICAMSKNFRLGNPKRIEDEQHMRWMSGWAVKKINDWINSQEECVPKFPQPDLRLHSETGIELDAPMNLHYPSL
ncbi:unnamed protein product [Periconia digitata]|uniref:N-acetylgalactosaminide beta-1,3-galactosyltransferase n=1 Tax=Periconia digitata TaxID=1303443 RepID=A0A9W4XPN3_9PLEO|nr:unnamed protein product [Periconia digitata]